MFPYPSGAGLHVGHPLGYIATDVYARYFRMTGRNVLHAMGFDAFGLPAEQYAVQTGTHPRTRTEANIVNFRRQLRPAGPRPRPAPRLRHHRRRLLHAGRSGSSCRSSTPGSTPQRNKARPISRADRRVRQRRKDARRRPGVVASCRPGSAPTSSTPTGWSTAPRRRSTGARAWARCWPTRRSPPTAAASAATSRCSEAPAAVDDAHHRLLRPPARGSRRAGLAGAGQGHAAQLDRPLHRRRRSLFAAGGDATIEVFTTRPDTLFGATYMVLAPEHALVDRLTAAQWPDGVGPAVDRPARATPAEAVAAYRRSIAAKSDLERQENKTKTGVFLGSLRHQPGQRTTGPGLHRRLRADRATAPARSWPCPATTSGTGSSPTEFGLPIVEVIAGGDVSRGRPTPATAPW